MDDCVCLDASPVLLVDKTSYFGGFKQGTSTHWKWEHLQYMNLSKTCPNITKYDHAQICFPIDCSLLETLNPVNEHQH